MTRRGRKGTAMIAVHEAWGHASPEWIVALAEECDRSSQREVAKVIGYSDAVVSMVLRNRYQGDMGAVEQAVSGALLDATVECPMVGDMFSDVCLDWQRKSKTVTPTSTWQVRMYEACRTCPNRREPL